jgi:hypothetical protein
MVLKAPQKNIFFGPNLKKNLLKNRLSLHVRNFVPLNEPPNIFIQFFYFNPKVASRRDFMV